MISIEVSPEKLQVALKVIATSHPEAKVTEESPTTGHVHTSQIDADYEYRQRSASDGTLVFTNEKKHGLYNMVSDDTIGAHLSQLLANLPENAPDSTNPEPIKIPAATEGNS